LVLPRDIYLLSRPQDLLSELLDRYRACTTKLVMVMGVLSSGIGLLNRLKRAVVEQVERKVQGLLSATTEYVVSMGWKRAI
jgi:hypothetical protein